MALQVRVGVEWVGAFHSGDCEQANLDYRDDHANGFFNNMGNHGHVKVFDWGNDNAWETDFRHPNSGGDSLNWTDNVNFVFFSSHGGNWSDVMRIAFATKTGKCLGETDEFRLGAKSLKWLALDCCDAVLNTDGSHIGSVWFPPMRGLHMVFGFIGLGHDGYITGGLGSDFGDDAGSAKPLSNAWLDRGYSWAYDDNPIAIAAGATEAEAINRRENETINWRDYDVSSTNWLAWKYRT